MKRIKKGAVDVGLGLFSDCQSWRNLWGYKHQLLLAETYDQASPTHSWSIQFRLCFLSLAMRDIQMSTAYAVWTGLGAAGAVLAGILIFKESASVKRIFFLSLIIVGAVGLKLFG